MINLGDKVKDSVTGFTGIAIGRTEWLHGCNRFIVQPAVNKSGVIPESSTFDEPQLVVITKKKIKKGASKTGGYSINIAQKQSGLKY